jgi:L-aminopeptidase/D-esterase-like protein
MFTFECETDVLTCGAGANATTLVTAASKQAKRIADIAEVNVCRVSAKTLSNFSGSQFLAACAAASERKQPCADGLHTLQTHISSTKAAAELADQNSECPQTRSPSSLQ